MYRPKEWQEKRLRLLNEEDYPAKANEFKHEIYEAGADAMYEPAKEEGKRELLEALKKDGLYGEYLEDYIISVAVKPNDKDWAEDFLASIEKKGYLVFIPEEEQ